MWTNSSASSPVVAAIPSFTEVPNPAEEQAYYRVEEEFTNAVSRHGADHHGALRNGRTLHGVDRSGHPQCPNRAGDLPAVVRPTRWTLAAHTLVLRRGTAATRQREAGATGVTAAAGSRADRAADCRRDCPLQPSHVTRPEAVSPGYSCGATLPYPETPVQPQPRVRHAMHRLAACRSGGLPRHAGDAASRQRGCCGPRGAPPDYFESQKAVEIPIRPTGFCYVADEAPLIA